MYYIWRSKRGWDLIHRFNSATLCACTKLGPGFTVISEVVDRLVDICGNVDQHNFFNCVVLRLFFIGMPIFGYHKTNSRESKLEQVCKYKNGRSRQTNQQHYKHKGEPNARKTITEQRLTQIFQNGSHNHDTCQEALTLKVQRQNKLSVLVSGIMLLKI